MISPRILFDGDPAEAYRYVGLAKKFGRSTFNAGILSKVWRFGEGVQIRVMNNIQARVCKVWITARGGDYYQFIGTGPWRYQDYLDELALPGVRYLPRVYAVLGQSGSAGWTARPLVTSLEEPPHPGDWTFDINPLNTNEYLYISPAHQPDGFGIHPFFTPTEDRPHKATPWLGTQWSQALPCHGLAHWSAGTGGGGFAPSDTGYDYPPTVFSATRPRAGAVKRPETDWYQRGCLRGVDGRTFVIMADVNSVFHCFPLGVETGDGIVEPNIPEEFLQSVVCPWPEWVTVEPLGEAVGSQVTRLRPRWTFAHDGTRGACIAAHRAEPWSDATYTSSVYGTDGSFQYPVQEDYPGVVEVAFSLTIDGENPEDFTFGVTLRQTIYCLETGRYPLEVGYALRAMGESIPLNALLVLEYQSYTHNPSMSASVDPAVEIDPISPTVEPESGWKMPERPAFAAVAIVSAQTELAGSWTEVRRWLAYYCAYPTRKTYGISRKEPRPFYPHLDQIPGAATESDWYDNHFEFITQLAAVNLPSMAFCLSATLSTYGAALPSEIAYAGDAITTEVIVWNELKETVSVGVEFLKSLAGRYLHNTADFPDWETMSRVYPGATLDYAYYGTVSHSSGIGQFDAATLTVRDGHLDSESTWSSVLARGYAAAAVEAGELAHYFGDVSYSPFTECPLFSGHARVYMPWVYLFFDTYPMVRPGFRWTQDGGRDISGSTWEAGSPSFTDFPYGITLANKIYNLTLAALGNVNANIHTHVNGSWSVFYGPFACQSEVVNYSDGIPLGHEQGMIDQVVRVHKDTEYATTHISLLNQAFHKSWTESDYYFSFRKVGSQVQFNPRLTYPADLGWFDVLNIPVGSGLAVEGIEGMYLTLTTAFNDFMQISYPLGSPVRYSLPNPRLESLFLGRS